MREVCCFAISRTSRSVRSTFRNQSRSLKKQSATGSLAGIEYGLQRTCCTLSLLLNSNYCRTVAVNIHTKRADKFEHGNRLPKIYISNVTCKQFLTNMPRLPMYHLLSLLHWRDVQSIIACSHKTLSSFIIARKEMCVEYISSNAVGRNIYLRATTLGINRERVVVKNLIAETARNILVHLIGQS